MMDFILEWEQDTLYSQKSALRKQDNGEQRRWAIDALRLKAGLMH
jgi:hypothetical protein